MSPNCLELFVLSTADDKTFFTSYPSHTRSGIFILHTSFLTCVPTFPINYAKDFSYFFRGCFYLFFFIIFLIYTSTRAVEPRPSSIVFYAKRDILSRKSILTKKKKNYVNLCAKFKCNIIL